MALTSTTGETLFEEGKFEQARKYYLNQLKSTPNDKEILNNLGAIYFNESELEKAAEYFRKSIEIDPNYLDAIINISELCNLAGSPDVSLNYLKHAKALYPENNEIKSLLSNLNQEAPQEISKANMNEANASKTDTLRILHGTYEIANQSQTMAQAATQAGQFAKTACYYPNYLKYKSDYLLDLAQFKTDQEAIAGTRAFAKEIIPQFDLFHFHFGTTLTLDFSDLPVIAESNKKMTMQYWGSDVRQFSIAHKLNPYIIIKKNFNEDTIRKNLELISKHIKQCVVCDYELYEYVKDYFEHTHVIPQVIDIDKYQPSETQTPNKTIMIVHAPTDTDVKGSTSIARAIEELQTDYDIDYQMIQGLSHDKAKEIYAQADLIVDQLHAGCHGLLAVECMAMGKPVITWISDFMKDKYPNELPIISANPDTIKEKIKQLLDNRELLPELGNKGRKYTEKYHDMNIVMKQMLKVYEAL